jgi:hypothetical protein
MFGGSNFDRSRKMFADQFEPDGQNFLYRKYMRGAPVRVSAAERDRYAATFDRFLKYQFWGMAAGIVVLTASVVSYAVVTNVDLPVMALYAGLGAILAAFMAGHFWIWNFPARELRGRPTIADTRSRAEMKRLYLERLTYGQIATAAGAAIVLLLRFRSGGSLLSGWNLLWTGMAAVMLVLCAVQAFRKWRLESKQP